MKKGVRLIGKAGYENGQSDGMNKYIKTGNHAPVYTYAANIRDARLHFKKSVGLFY